jgi:DDE superfamily endonuclease
VPQRELVVVADSSFAALEFLAATSQLGRPVAVITRLRLDAGLYEPPPVRCPKQMGRPRIKGKRLPTLATLLTTPNRSWQSVTIENWYGNQPRTVEILSDTALWYHTGLPAVPIRWILVRDPDGKFKPQAFLCTNLTTAPVQILTWFRLRWQVEVTFEEVRAHLGVETQRQWSDKAIARTTPALFALFSIVVVFAHELLPQQQWHLRQSAWYVKSCPTFVDALALVRSCLWAARLFQRSPADATSIKVPSAVFGCWLESLCYAA